jgi:maleate cis-trans isomerase
MRTIRHLGTMDRLFGVPVITRNWNTIIAIVKTLEAAGQRAAMAGGDAVSEGT